MRNGTEDSGSAGGQFGIRVWVIGGPVAGAVVLGLAVGLMVWWWRRRRRTVFFQPSFRKPSGDRDSGHDYESQEDLQHCGGFQQFQTQHRDSDHVYESHDPDRSDDDSENGSDNDYVNVPARPANHAVHESSLRASNEDGVYLSYSSLDVNIYANYEQSENDNDNDNY